MLDIKEKQPIKTVTKERKTTVPKELVRRGATQTAVKTKQQLIEASRGAEPEEQGSQQNAMEIPSIPRPHGTKKVKEFKTEPKTRENYIEDLQHRHTQPRDYPEGIRNKYNTNPVDIKPEIKSETEPVAIPQQGSQALAEFQGRNATRKKLVQKQVDRNKKSDSRYKHRAQISTANAHGTHITRKTHRKKQL